MKKTILTMVIMGLFFACNIMAQITFERSYGGQDSYTCYSVTQTSDGGYLAAGSINHIDTDNMDVYLLKTDAYGDTIWTHTYDKQNTDIGYFLQQTADGGYIITGYTGNWPDLKALLIKTDAAGDTLWTRTYTGGVTVGYFGKSVQQTSDGGYIITGYTSNPDYSNDIFLIKTDSSGETLWTQIYDNQENDIGNSVKQTLDGGYIIAGTTSFMWYSDVFLIKTDAEGDTLWTQTYGDTDSQEGTNIQLTSDGGYIICGNYIDVSNNTNVILLLKIDDSGQVIWSQSYGNIYDDLCNSVQQTSDGGFIIAGYTGNYPNMDIYIVKTDNIGDTLWSRSFGSENPEFGYSVQQTADEGYIIAGYSNNQSTSRDEVYILKTDENGMVLDPGWITGNIFLDGGSGNVEDVEVTAGSVTVNPDINGNYTIEIEPGTYDVTATLEDYDPDTVNGIVVEEGIITSGVDLTLVETVGTENIIITITELIGNYPNPFNPITIISYSLAEEGNIELIVFNIKGQQVKTLINEKLPAGNHQVVWDGKDVNSKTVSSGIYFYKMNTNDYTSIKKMILMK